MTEEDRQLLTQRATLQTAAVIEHISHEQAKIWLLCCSCSFSPSRLSLVTLFLLLHQLCLTPSLSHTHGYNWGCFFTLSRNPGEPWSWPTCNYSIFRVSSKRHREPRDMARSGISKNGLRDLEQGGETGGECHWLNLDKPCNTILSFSGNRGSERCYMKTEHHIVSNPIVSLWH